MPAPRCGGLSAVRQYASARSGPTATATAGWWRSPLPATRAQSLQQALLAAGEARVAPRVGDMACARRLLAAEKAARAARRGLWADPRFLPINAGDIGRLRAEAGKFTLVEGKVLSVHPTGGTIYLNFGRRWTRDFSVIILRRRQRSFAAAGIDPMQLRGRTLRVRGVIEMRRGPVIEAEAPEQIELANGGLGPGTDK